LNKQVINHNRQSLTERKGTPLRRMGVQPVVIGGSDSAELDKFQWQRDRALHQIQCFRSDKATSIFVLSISRIIKMQRKGPGAFEGGTLVVVCLFAREATRRKEQARKAKQRRVQRGIGRGLGVGG
jgi:hypothetical protein